MITSKPNHIYNAYSDDELLEEYIKQENARLFAVNSGEDFLADTIESIIFQIDDELCARGLDLPC